MNEADQAYVIGRGLAAIRSSVEESEYLWQALLWSVGSLSRVSQGSTFQAINKDDLEELLIPHPPEAERRFAATVLRSVDEAIEATRVVIEQTRRVKSALLQELLTKGLISNGRKQKQTKHLGRIPAHWNESQLGYLLAEPIRNGFSPISPNQFTGHWVTTLSCVSPHGFQAHGVKPADPADTNVQATVLKVGDILVSRSNTRDLVGLAGIYGGTPFPCSYSDLLMRVRVDQSLILNSYSLLWILSARSRDYFSKTSRGTSGSMKKIDRAILEHLPVPLPPIDEQRRIVEIDDSFSATLNSNLECLDRLVASKSALSQGLLTGRIPVTVPAAKLAASQGMDARKSRKD